jgi:hypothetical protein
MPRLSYAESPSTSLMAYKPGFLPWPQRAGRSAPLAKSSIFGAMRQLDAFKRARQCHV